LLSFSTITLKSASNSSVVTSVIGIAAAWAPAIPAPTVPIRASTAVIDLRIGAPASR
jgi:hypothetical protein